MKCAGTFSSLSSLRKWKTPASRTGASAQAIHDAVHLRKVCEVSVWGEAELTNNSGNAAERKSVQRFRMILTVSDYSPKEVGIHAQAKRTQRRVGTEAARSGQRFFCRGG